MPADGKGAKGGDVMTKTHAAGAAGSYGARYLIKGIFNVAVGDDGLDGNEVRGRAPEPPALISNADVALIEQYCHALGGNTRSAMLNAYKVEAIPDLTDKQAGSVIRRLKERLDEKVATEARAETNAEAARHA